jgi:hypothetical protein
VNAQTVEKQKMPPGLVLAAVVLLALVLVAVVIMRDKEPAEPNKSTPAPAPRGKGKVPAAGDAPGEPSQSAPDGGTDG